MKYGFGVDLGGTTVKIAYFDEFGNMFNKWEIPTDRSENGKNILPDIAKSIKEYIKMEGISRKELVGIGIGVPGAVLPDGTVRQVYFYCVDVSEFAVNKLADRGSLSARGIVTNVQDFVVLLQKSLAGRARRA